jgi:hypothetical protein
MYDLKISIAKDVLLKILETNRTEHVAKYGEAKEKYLGTVKQWLLDRMEENAKGIMLSQGRHPMPTHPQSYESDYRRAEHMVKAHVGDSVELSQVDYNTLVMDEWNWSRGWGQTVSSYGIQNKYEV